MPPKGWKGNYKKEPIVTPAETSEENIPEKIRKLQQQEVTLDEQQPEDSEEKPKRKYTRRQSSIDVSSFLPLSGVLLDLTAPRMPNPIPFTETEKELFAKALEPVLTKYLPMAGDYAPELTLAVTVSILLAPRLQPEKKETIIQVEGTSTAEKL